MKALLEKQWEKAKTSAEPIYRFECEFSPRPLLNWLRSQTLYPKLYWVERDEGCEIASIGSIDTVTTNRFSSLEEALRYMENESRKFGPYIRYYGGISFPTEQKWASEWNEFNAFHFFIPKMEIKTTPEKTLLSYYVKKKDLEPKEPLLKTILNEASRLQKPSSFSLDQSAWHFSCDTPSFEQWKNSVQAAQALEQDGLSKIVLSRKTTYSLDSYYEPEVFMRHLKESCDPCFYFIVQLSPKTTFLGASPELLFKRDGSTLFTEAIAGTRRRGMTRHEDLLLEEELIKNDKEKEEHAIVVRTIMEALTPLCERVHFDQKPSLLKLSKVQHLITHLRGTLLDNISTAQLTTALHPTPAVGGYPVQKALSVIPKLEPFERGWYSGLIGWIQSESCTFAVAIRSALHHEKELTLYAGAGIMRTSVPELEWEEITHKMASFLQAFSSSKAITHAR